MSIEKRGNLYRVTLIIRGKLYRGTFKTLKEAKAYSKDPSGYFEFEKNISFKELLERYADEEAKWHKGAKQDILRIKKIQRDRRFPQFVSLFCALKTSMTTSVED